MDEPANSVPVFPHDTVPFGCPLPPELRGKPENEPIAYINAKQPRVFHGSTRAPVALGQAVIVAGYHFRICRIEGHQVWGMEIDPPPPG